jgi:hypothetical protein
VELGKPEEWMHEALVSVRFGLICDSSWLKTETLHMKHV